MYPILIGAVLGIVGGLTGSVFALWWKSKAAKAGGKVSVIALKLKQEQKEHDDTLNRAKESAEKFEEGRGRNELLIKDLEARLEKLREREVSAADLDTLIGIANSLSEKGSDPVEDKDGDSGSAMQDSPSTEDETVPIRPV